MWPKNKPKTSVLPFLGTRASSPFRAPRRPLETQQGPGSRGAGGGPRAAPVRRVGGWLGAGAGEALGPSAGAAGRTPMPTTSRGFACSTTSRAAKAHCVATAVVRLDFPARSWAVAYRGRPASFIALSTTRRRDTQPLTLLDRLVCLRRVATALSRARVTQKRH